MQRRLLMSEAKTSDQAFYFVFLLLLYSYAHRLNRDFVAKQNLVQIGSLPLTSCDVGWVTKPLNLSFLIYKREIILDVCLQSYSKDQNSNNLKWCLVQSRLSWIITIVQILSFFDLQLSSVATTDSASVLLVWTEWVCGSFCRRPHYPLEQCLQSAPNSPFAAQTGRKQVHGSLVCIVWR